MESTVATVTPALPPPPHSLIRQSMISYGWQCLGKEREWRGRMAAVAAARERNKEGEMRSERMTETAIGL